MFYPKHVVRQGPLIDHCPLGHFSMVLEGGYMIGIAVVGAGHGARIIFAYSRRFPMSG